MTCRLALRALLLSVVALAILVGQASSGSAQNLGNPNPGVAPIHSSVRGMTYPEWRAALYIFLMGTPRELSPANDPTGEVSGALQSKDMYFLKYSIANGDWFDSEYTFTWECDLTVEN